MNFCAAWRGSERKAGSGVQIEREAQAKAEARRTELEDQAKAVEAEAQLIREKAAQSAGARCCSTAVCAIRHGLQTVRELERVAVATGNVEAKQAEADRLRAEKEAIAKRLAEINRQIMRSEGKGGASLVEDARKREERLQQHVRRLEARCAPAGRWGVVAADLSAMLTARWWRAGGGRRKRWRSA